MTGQIDFQGELRTDAKVSEMTSGVKSFFLKLIDPLFAKEGMGAIIPSESVEPPTPPPSGWTREGSSVPMK